MIYSMHGIIKRTDKKIDSYNGNGKFIDADVFENFIKSAPKKFVSIEEAIKGKGDAITIDDSIFAASDAAEILIANGHKVTLFINPYYIDTQTSYWFSVLDTLLKHQFDNVYVMDDINEKRNFFASYRKTIKKAMMNISTEEKKIQFLFNFFGVDPASITIESHLQTITKQKLYELKNKGVNIQNHGWFHIKHGKDNINKAAKWIFENLNEFPTYYAVPFGEKETKIPLERNNLQMCFYDSVSISPGPISANEYNREKFLL